MMGSFSRLIAVLAAAVTLFSIQGCTQLTLDWARLAPSGDAALPDLASDAETIDRDPSEWAQIREGYLAVLGAEVYGQLPDSGLIEVVSRKVLDEAAFDGRAVLEEFVLKASPGFNGVQAQSSAFLLDLLTPTSNDLAPVIILQTFCSRASSLPHPMVEGYSGASNEMGGLFGSLAKMVFGRHICTPPIEALLDQGYALAFVQPSEFVADRPTQGLNMLAELSLGHEDERTRWGAIAAWAWQATKIVDVLETHDRLDRNKFVIWGHSRFGKSALLAMALDDRIDGAIAHQSGTGGASLNRNKRGESISSITKNYPHWFSQNYASFGDDETRMTSDQHLLLAALAPRPVLLGNARRDVWSDPNGAFRAAIGADTIYERLGAEGVRQERLDAFHPEAELSYWIRPGTHGVVKEDWEAFLMFLAAHFPAFEPAQSVRPLDSKE